MLLVQTGDDQGHGAHLAGQAGIGAGSTPLQCRPVVQILLSIHCGELDAIALRLGGLHGDETEINTRNERLLTNRSLIRQELCSPANHLQGPHSFDIEEKCYKRLLLRMRTSRHCTA